MLTATSKPKPAQFGTVPGTTVSLLTDTSKMPWYSWSLLAHTTCPGEVTGPGTICGACYAKKGMYLRSRVQRAQQARWEWARTCMKSMEGRKEFVWVMSRAINLAHNKTGGTHFRVHDSGDLFNARYTECWQEICANLPMIQFWFPTRSYRLTWVAALYQLATLPNVTVRPSALYFGEKPPEIEGLHAGSGAGKEFNCPAFYQDNACGECRACWTEKEKPIVYHAH